MAVLEETIYILSNGNEVPESWLLEQADLAKLSLKELLAKNPDISIKPEEMLPYGYDETKSTKYNPEYWKGEEKQEELTTLVDKYLNKEFLTIQEELLVSDYIDSDDYVQEEVEETYYPEKLVSLTPEGEQIWQTTDDEEKVGAKEITFDEFDAFESEDEALEVLEKKYPYLKFDIPVVVDGSIGGGWGADIIQVTNPENDETFDLFLNTAYNRKNNPNYGGEARAFYLDSDQKKKLRQTGGFLSPNWLGPIDGKEIYNKFISFAMSSRFGEDGKPTTKVKSLEDLETFEGQFLLDDGTYQQLTPEITEDAIELIRQDKTGELTPERAIEIIINSPEEYRSSRWLQWDKNLLNENIKIKQDLQDQVGEMIKGGFNPNRLDVLNIEALISLGMPEEVVQVSAGQFIDRQGQVRQSAVEAQKKEQIRNWLSTTDEGQVIMNKYNQVQIDKSVKNVSDKYVNIADDEVDRTQYDNEVEYKAAVEKRATELQNEALDETGDKVLAAEYGNFGMSQENLDKVYALRDKIKSEDVNEDGIVDGDDDWERNKLEYEYLNIARAMVGDSEIRLLKNADGTWKDGVKQEQKNQALANQQKQLSNFENYLFSSNNDLNNIFNRQNAELYTIAEELVNKGYSETMLEGSFGQQIGEGISRFAAWSTGIDPGLVGTAKSDFEKLQKWVETGEMPVYLTTLPTGNDPLLDRYNELLQDRTTLLLAKSLNLDVSTFGRAKGHWYSGAERMWNSMNENWLPAVGGEQLGEAEMRNRFTQNILKNELGFELTEQQNHEASLQIDTWERAGASVPGFTRMAAEMALTYALTGGVGNLTNFISGIARNSAAFAVKRWGLSLSSAKMYSKYVTGVGVEYVGLLGSNTIGSNVFRQEGIENPLLFAMGSRFGHGLLAKTGNMYSSAIRKYAAHNPRFRNALDKVYKFPGTATGLGALKFTAAPVGGVVGIKSGEFLTGLADVAIGDKDMSALWNEVTDSDSLMETYMALMFMKGSRPDQFVKGAVETFRYEVDVLRRNNPGWNQLRRTLGMKTVDDKDVEVHEDDGGWAYAADAIDFHKEVDAALEIQINKLKQKNLPPKQYQEQLRKLKFSANRLKLKPALDQISRDFEAQDLKPLRNELTSVAKNLASSGVELSVDNILVLSESGWGNGGSSPILELMANGFTEIQATNLFKFSQRMQNEAQFVFGNNVNAPGFKKYVKESIKESQLEVDRSSLDTQLKEKSISSAAYEVKKSQLDLKQKEIDLEKKKLINQEDIERAGRSAKTVKEYKKAGFEIIEGGNEVIAEARKEIGGEFKETEIGLQGINPKTGKGVILINTDAQKRYKKGSTVIHEGWHFPFEKKLNSMSKKDAIKYVQDFEQALKNKGLHTQVLQEMFERPGFVNEIIKNLDVPDGMWNTLDIDGKVKLYEAALKNGMKMPLSEAKEFINEFIELENDGRFDYAIGSKKIKKIRKENKEKEVTDIEFKTGKDIVDFVMSGGTRRTGVVEALAKSKTEYEASMKGKKSELSASEKGPVKIEDIKSVGKDAEVISAKQVEKIIGRVAGAAWNKYGSRIPKNIAEAAGVTRRSYIESAKSELASSKWIKKWNGDKQPFNQYVANKGMLELKTLATELGVESKDAPVKKRISDKVDSEGKREFDVASKDMTPEEAMISKQSKDKSKEKLDRQVSMFEGKEAKAKEKEISNIFKDLSKKEIEVRSKKGLAGTPKEELTKVAELLFDIDGTKVTDLSKSSYPSVDLVNPKTGKKLTPKQIEKGVKGILDAKDFVNIRDYFKDPSNLNRFLKTLPEYNITGMESRINQQGEIIDVSRDVLGKGIRLTDRVYDYFYEPYIDPTGKITSPKGRSKGLTTQTPVKRLKPKFRDKISKEVIAQLRKDLLLDVKAEELIDVYDRTLHGQLVKGMAKLEAMKVANEATRKPLPKETPTEKQLYANVRAAVSRMQASEKGGIHSSIKKIAGELDRTDPESVKRMTDVILKDMLPVFKELIYALIKPSTIGAAGARATTKSKAGAVDRWFLWINDVMSGRKQTPLSLSETQAYVEAGLLGEISTLIKAIEAKGIKEKSRKDRGLEESFASEQTLKNIDYNLKNLKELQGAYKNIIKKFKKVYDNNPDTLPVLKEFLYHPNANAHIGKNFSLMRSKQKGATETNKYEEHGYQFGNWAKRTLEAITHKNPKALEGWLNWSAKNYYQTAFNKTTKILSIEGDMRTYQGIVDLTYGDWKAQSQEHPFLKEALDKAFKTGDFSKVPPSEIRFFNEHFTLNPNVLFKDGKSFAKIYNVEVPKSLENNPNIIKIQGRLIFEQMTTPLTAKQAREIIKLETRKEIVAEQNKARKFDLKELEKPGVLNLNKRMPNSDLVNKAGKIDKALDLARKMKKPIKKARVFDFDDTVARTKSNVLYEMPDGKKGKITAEEFAKKGEIMEAEGAVWDFSEFNKVIDGKKGPLFEVMKRMKEAAGDRDLFILTARAPEAAPAIHRFLKEMGIDIPLENIKGLKDSSPYAKSDWIIDKAAEGYNDFYFADDHIANVKAVRDVLEQIDVKSKVQQAKMNASERLDKEFNKILEEKSGIEWYKEFSETKGKLVGAKKGRGKFFLPPGAEDFTGLIYPTLGKGKKGDAQLKWYNDNLIKPYTRATRNLAADKIQLMTDFKGLKKKLDIPKDLRKNTDVGYTKEQIARIYLWNKMGEKIPGISKKDLKEVLDVVEKDAVLRTFADQILEITKGDGYSKPSKEWLAGTITTDLINLLNKTKRAKYLQEWSENIDVVFSKKNLNKLEAIYGPKYRTALENSILRMKTGRNRTSTGNKASDRLLDYINGAQGTIMFLNMRSAVLQSISAANFINVSFNNPIKAGKAFINQKRYWKDFMSIMNSDYLVGRRQGLKLNISESEISEAAAGSTNKAKAVINYILEKGYAPTKFMDSFAIASGGATWYRNKIKDLMKKEGLSEAEAQKKAFEEFMEISEKSQQSSDPSKISAQQASDKGRIFLQFVNTPMQYTRLQKRAVQDLANKRGDWKANISKILYYGVVQNLWFNAMQQGLFALGFGDDEINEKEETKIINTANGMADSILRGTGFAGMTLSVLKNTVIDLYRRSGKKLPNYRDAWVKLLEFSPAVKSKVSKLRSAAWPFDTKKGREEIKEKGFSLDNPAYESLAKVISAVTNIPLDRLYSKYNNLSAMMSEDTETWKDIALFLGWPEYQLEEGGTVADDLSRNISELNKVEQIIVLEKLGVSAEEIKDLKKEGDRVNKMMELYNKDKEKVEKILKEELKEKPKTKEDELKIKIYKYSKQEQVMILEKLGVNKKSIKDLKTEKQRVDKINSLYNENSKDTDKVFGEVENYVPPKPSKREVRFEKLKDKTKNEQILLLLEYGLNRREIQDLYYENNRVAKIIELQDK